MQKIIAVFITLLICSQTLAAQQTGYAKYALIKGRVVEAGSQNTPISFATVHILPQDLYVTTDISGHYELKNVEPGKTSFRIQFIGMETIDTVFNVIPGKVYTLNFKMKETSFRLNEVTIQATASKAGNATASNVSRQAMDHLQTSSLKDIMQLLPGGNVENSNMTVANNFYIRTLTPSATSRSGSAALQDKNANMNSLGTAIIVDGAPLSNNANMQSLAPTIGNSSVAVGESASPAGGVDLRTISTDNIESVEVIRGIPSVEYGDLTSGAVIIKSRAGKEPLSVRFKINPFTYQVAASKGLSLGEKRGALNISGDYAYDVRSQTESYRYYQRFILKGLWTKTLWDKFYMNTALELNYNKDSRDKNPNDARTQLESSAKEIGFRLNNNGTFNTSDAGWLKNIKYTLQFSYKDKHSYQQELLENAFAPYSMSMTDGAILSNKAGQHVYDNNGNEITNIPDSEQNYYATYLPNAYFSRYDLYGKELNLSAKITSSFNKRWTSNNNNMLLGVDYKMDGNVGKGIKYDLATPPYRTFSNAAYRPRAFSEIPFIHQTGIFAEDTYIHSFGKHDLNISAGVRFDFVNGKKAVSPRINGSFEIVPQKLFIRLGYGQLAKAPTALYLYPQKAYFDYINFNNLGDATVPEKEQILLGTTRVFDVKNNDLKIAKNEKSEIGFDWTFNKQKMSISVTGYYEKLKNGYTMGSDLSCFEIIPYKVYKLYRNNPGAIPTLQLANSYNIFANYNKPMNTLFSTNKGIEYEINLGRINSIRTAFNINGAWMHTKTVDMNYSYSTNSNGNNLERNIGVYEKGVERSFKEKFNTMFRVTHNIPRIGFVITLSAQVDWFTKKWYEYGNDTMFEKYISYLDGKVYDFNPAKKDDPEFAYLFDVKNDNRFTVETYFPTAIFNIMISKEIGNFLTASFYVNNLLNSRPLYESKAYPGSFTELGIPTFFGFDLKINIK